MIDYENRTIKYNLIQEENTSYYLQIIDLFTSEKRVFPKVREKYFARLKEIRDYQDKIYFTLFQNPDFKQKETLNLRNAFVRVYNCLTNDIPIDPKDIKTIKFQRESAKRLTDILLSDEIDPPIF